MGDDEIKRFSLKRREEPVLIEDEAGRIFKFTIREMSGRDRDTYTTFLLSKQRLDADGRPTNFVKDATGLESSLLAKCLCGEDGKLVKQDVIDGYPANMQHALFLVAQELNAVDQEAAKRVGEG